MGSKAEWVRPDGRAGRWAKRESRRRQWEVFRRNWLALVSVPVLAAVLGLALGFYVRGWWGGLLAGAIIAIGVAAPTHLLMMITGSAPRSMGASAEEQVSEAIVKGLVAHASAFDRVTFRGWDVDHLVVLRSKALVVETKWSSESWVLSDRGDDRLMDAVRQVKRGARSVRVFLRSSQIGLPLDVQYLVVVCGRTDSGDDLVGSIDGCPVVHVQALRSWIRSWCQERGAPELDRDVFNAGCENISSFLETRDEYDDEHVSEHFFVLHGVLAPMQAGWEGVTAFLLGVILPGSALGLGRQSPWLGLALMGAAMAGGALVLWRSGRKPALVGWASGAAVLLGSVSVAIMRASW